MYSVKYFPSSYDLPLLKAHSTQIKSDLIIYNFWQLYYRNTNTWKQTEILVPFMKFLHHRILEITPFTCWMQHMDLHSEMHTLHVPRNKCLYVNTVKSTSQNFYSSSSIVWTLQSTEYRGMGMRKTGQTKNKYWISVEESLGKKAASRWSCQNMINITLWTWVLRMKKCM